MNQEFTAAVTLLALLLYLIVSLNVLEARRTPAATGDFEDTDSASHGWHVRLDGAARSGVSRSTVHQGFLRSNRALTIDCYELAQFGPASTMRWALLSM